LLKTAENKDNALLDSIKKRLEISIHKHGSKVIAITAHHDCAGNPVEKDAQVAHLREAKKTVESWNFNAEILMFWIDENLIVHPVK
jgi:hypothetical protein